MMTMMALVPQHAHRKAGDGKSAIDDVKQRRAIAHQACRYQGTRSDCATIPGTNRNDDADNTTLR